LGTALGEEGVGNPAQPNKEEVRGIPQPSEPTEPTNPILLL